jgi:hypothetical protein
VEFTIFYTGRGIDTILSINIQQECIHSLTVVENSIHIIYQSGEVHDYSQSAKIRTRGAPRVVRREGYKGLLHRGLYRVSTLKVEHRQLTLCIQFIDIMPLFRYINNMY